MKSEAEMRNEAIALEQIRDLFQVPGRTRLSAATVVRRVKGLLADWKLKDEMLKAAAEKGGRQ